MNTDQHGSFLRVCVHRCSSVVASAFGRQVMGSKLLVPSVALAVSAAAAATFGALALGGSPVGGSVEILTLPPGASVFVDGEFRGVSPVTVDHLDPGSHALRAEKGDFKPLITGLVVKDEHSRRTFALSPAPRGALEVSSTPPGAEVFLDGRFRGVTPLALEGLRTGPHALSVEKANHNPWSGTVLVPDGRVAEVSCELEDRILEYLRNALADRPDEIPRYMELAHYHFIVGDFESAADVYRRGLILAADKLAEMQSAILKARETGDAARARSLEAERNRTKTEKKKLDRQMQRDRKSGGRDFRAVMEAVQREIRAVFPRSVAVALKEAEAAERRGEPARAAEIVERALKVLPASAMLWERLARYRAKLGDLDVLKASLRRAFRYSGADAGVRVRLTEVCLDNAERFEGEGRRKLFELLAGELARTRRRGDEQQRRLHALMEYRANREAGRVSKAMSALRESLKNTDDREAIERLKAEARRWLEDVAERSRDRSARAQARTELGRL